MAKRKRHTMRALRQNQRRDGRRASRDLHAVLQKHLDDEESRLMTACKGEWEFIVPRLTSEERLDTCRTIIESSEQVWEEIHLSVSEIEKRVRKGRKEIKSGEKESDTYVSIFGGMTTDEIAFSMEQRREQYEGRTKDDIVGASLRTMALTLAFRDVVAEKGYTGEEIGMVMDMCEEEELSDIIRVMEAQIGLARYQLEESEKESKKSVEEKKK